MLKKSDHFIILGLGLEFAIIMCLGFFAGRWLDMRFGTKPWLLLLSCAAAFAMGLYMIVISARAAVGKEAAAPAKPEDKK